MAEVPASGRLLRGDSSKAASGPLYGGLNGSQLAPQLASHGDVSPHPDGGGS